MKKLLVIFGLILIAFGMFAQGSADVIIRSNKDYGYFVGAASDTINGATTADAVFYLQGKRGMYLLSYMVDADTLNGGGSNSVTIQPQGSYDGATYTNIGSAITWGATADTAFNKQVHSTYSVAVAGTETTAAFNVTADTTGLSGYFADTLAYAQQTNTVSLTNTVTLPGVDYNYIKILLTGGGASARCELQLVAIKVTEISLPIE